jgi:hypothetical protein
MTFIQPEHDIHHLSGCDDPKTSFGRLPVERGKVFGERVAKPAQRRFFFFYGVYTTGGHPTPSLWPKKCNKCEYSTFKAEDTQKRVVAAVRVCKAQFSWGHQGKKQNEQHEMVD